MRVRGESRGWDVCCASRRARESDYTCCCIGCRDDEVTLGLGTSYLYAPGRTVDLNFGMG
jgi:hypothetical protein